MSGEIDFESFNCNTYELDGHDELAIINAINSTQKSDKPVAIICNTIKGKGVSFMENNNLWHYRTPKGEDLEAALREIKNR